MTKVDEEQTTLIGQAPRVTQTQGMDRGSSASETEERVRNEEGWQKWIDSRLIEWGRDPSVLEDDGIDPPTQAAVGAACELAIQMQKRGLKPPTHVVPDGDGGIVFDIRAGEVLESLEVAPDGSIEYLLFVNDRLDHRQALGAFA